MARINEARSLTRREFTLASLNALFVGMVVTVTACKGGGGNASPAPTPGPTPTPSQSGDVAGVISNNHGHAAIVTKVQMQTGGAVTLDIQGTADHDHTVELSAAQVQQIAAGARVTKVSSVGTTQVGDGYGGSSAYDHSHNVTFN